MVAISERYKENNPLINSNIAILCTSYEAHKPFLKYALSRYRETGSFIILAYDRHNDTIPNDIMNIPHSIVYKHQTYGAEKRLGWLWDIVYGSVMISLYENFEYIVTVNGDTVWDKPEGIKDLIKLLGNNDIMSASSNGIIHTCNVIFRRKCFLGFINYVKKKLEVNIPEGYSPEVLLKDFISNSNYKNKVCPEQPRFPKEHFYAGQVDHYSSYNQNCTWKQLVGYRNLGGEMKVVCQQHLKPLDKKYLDLRNNGEFFNKHEQDTLCKFYITNDYRYFYQYLDTGEDSFFNRRYLPLEYYGNEVLKDDSKRKEFGPYSERSGFFNKWKYNSYIIKDKEYTEKWKTIIKEKGYDN